MKVDFSVEIEDEDGEPLREDGDRKLTLGTLCVRALVRNLQGDSPLTPEEAVRRWDFARQIRSASAAGVEPVLEIRPEDAALLRDRLARGFQVLAAGQACKLLMG